MPRGGDYPSLTTPAIAQRTAYIHVGTHKTGTTSIQALLAANAGTFAHAGIYVPATGRLTPSSAGHHNIAFELCNSHRFDPNLGTLEALVREIECANSPVVCVSSEEFEVLAGDVVALRRLANAFRSAGYEPRAILYLRPQADYLESLYAELIIGGWPIEFEEFRSTVAACGRYVNSDFDYDRLTQAFEAVFGRAGLRVRAYDAQSSADRLLADFVEILCADRDALDFRALQRPGRLNRRSTVGCVFDARARQRGVSLRATPHLGDAHRRSAEFAPLTLLEIIELAVRFGPSNERVLRRFGVRVAAVTWARLARELITMSTGGRAARERKALARASWDPAHSQSPA